MNVKDLSIEAQVLLAGMFAEDSTVLTMGNEKSRLSDEAARAMSELIWTGYVIARKAKDSRPASITYRLSSKGKQADRAKPAKWMQKHGRFALSKEMR